MRKRIGLLVGVVALVVAGCCGDCRAFGNDNSYWEEPEIIFQPTIDMADIPNIDLLDSSTYPEWVWQYQDIGTLEGREVASLTLRNIMADRFYDDIPDNKLTGEEVAILWRVLHWNAPIETIIPSLRDTSHPCYSPYYNDLDCWINADDLPIYGPGFGFLAGLNGNQMCNDWCQKRGHSSGQLGSGMTTSCVLACEDIWRDARDAAEEAWDDLWNFTSPCAEACKEAYEDPGSGIYTCDMLQECLSDCASGSNTLFVCDPIAEAVEDFYFCMLGCCVCTASP